MNLTSCTNCGVVLDKYRLHFPLEIDSDDGSIDDRRAAYNHATSRYEAFVPCPVCQEPILESQ